MNTLTNRLKVPILVGPTGVGKSEVAYRLALETGHEIISADAFQVFKDMTIGTAQPPLEYQKLVPHHLIGTRDIGQAWNAVCFATEASRILQNSAKPYLIVGGAGFYLRALVEGPPEGSAASPEVRAMVSQKVESLGPEKAHLWLAERDPAAAERLNPNDLRRVCRALEKSFADIPAPSEYEPLGPAQVRFIGLERSREKLDQLLKKRTEVMWRQGLLKETENLLKLQLPAEHPALAAIGYAEATAYLNHQMTEEEALERIFRRTRQYAKRQWTWFKHQHDVEWVDLDLYPNIEAVLPVLKEKLF